MKLNEIGIGIEMKIKIEWKKHSIITFNIDRNNIPFYFYIYYNKIV